MMMETSHLKLVTYVNSIDMEPNKLYASRMNARFTYVRRDDDLYCLETGRMIEPVGHTGTLFYERRETKS
jgi:hypothetical protein